MLPLLKSADGPAESPTRDNDGSPESLHPARTFLLPQPLACDGLSSSVPLSHSLSLVPVAFTRKTIGHFVPHGRVCAIAAYTGALGRTNSPLPPSARSSADVKRNQTPTRHTLAKDTIIVQIPTPQAASSQRTHVSRTQRCGRMHPVHRRVTTQYLHTQSITTRRRCGRNCRCNGKHEAPRELSAHRGIGIAAEQVESKVSGAARVIVAYTAELARTHSTLPPSLPVLVVTCTVPKCQCRALSVSGLRAHVEHHDVNPCTSVYACTPAYRPRTWAK